MRSNRKDIEVFFWFYVILMYIINMIHHHHHLFYEQIQMQSISLNNYQILKSYFLFELAIILASNQLISFIIFKFNLKSFFKSFNELDLIQKSVKVIEV